MSRYRVTYTTPAATGTAVIDADGIVAARVEAHTAVQILTGHAPDHITIAQIADSDGVPLWVADDQPTPQEWHDA